MPTRAEVRQGIIPRLVRYKQDRLVWSDITSAVTNASPDQRDEIVVSIRQANAQRLLRVMQKVMRQELRSWAQTEADTILSDDQMTLDELEKVYGPY